MPTFSSPDLLASWDKGEDAALWKIDDERVGILTVDFITPVVDSPRKFGEIAAANSLSDVYAMGGRPLIALNVLCFPTSCEPLSVLQEILLGGADKVLEAGAVLAGGHSVQDDEPKYGLVVFGEVYRSKMWQVGAAKDGDSLILTKPIGTGIAATAIKAGLYSDAGTDAAIDSMSKLNSVPSKLSDIASGHITSCTDVTGFGLAAHALDLCSENISLAIRADALPILPGIGEMANMGLIPAGSYANKEHIGHFVINDSSMGRFAEDLAFDPQTSGGLLLSVSREFAGQILNELRSAGFAESSIIGEFFEGKKHLILK